MSCWEQIHVMLTKNNTVKNLLFLLLLPALGFSQNTDIVNTEKRIGIKNWNKVNDGVMGGISTSKIRINNDGNIVFSGALSLKNNGGFASMRLGLNALDLAEVKSFNIKFKGDGKTYKLRIRQNHRRVSYSHSFKSVNSKWIEKNILVSEFKPTWRGINYSNYPDLETEKINSVGLQISDKQEGTFELELKHIKAIY